MWRKPRTGFQKFLSISIAKRLSLVFWLLVSIFIIYFVQTTRLLNDSKFLFSGLTASRVPTLIKWSELILSDLDQMRSSALSYTLSNSTTELGAVQFSNQKIIENFKKIEKESAPEARVLRNLFEQYGALYKEIDSPLNQFVSGLGNAEAQAKLNQALEHVGAFQSALQLERDRLESEYSRLLLSAARSFEFAWLVNLILVAIALPTVLLFRQSLTQIISALYMATGRITGASQNIVGVSSAAQMASGNLGLTSKNQTESVTEIRASMKELASGINETIGQCDAGLKTVDRMYSQAEQGVAVSQSLGGFMTDLELTYGELEAIHRAISEVSNMTDLINNIVFKTQILSFNASIEAAAAGAHGSGFAFIAAEVGKLANTTGTAAEQIGQQVEASRKLIQKTLEASRSRVAKAQGATRDGSRYFEELVGQAKDVKNVMNTIHETATLQGNKATTVSRGVDQINEGTSTLERAVHSVSGISKNMESQAQDLAVAVGGLKGLIQGGGSSDRDKKAA